MFQAGGTIYLKALGGGEKRESESIFEELKGFQNGLNVKCEEGSDEG